MRCVVALLFLLAFSATSPLAFWTEMAGLPGSAGRHHPVNFVLDGYGYVVTGSVPGDNHTDNFYRYDPTNDTWDVLPPFPGTDRSYAYGGAYGGKGYLGFGTSPAYLNDLWEYDPVTEQWTQLAFLPAPGRAHPAFVVTDDGKIFVGMGNAASNFRDWWEYDIAGNVWTQRADLPGAARHHPYYFNIGDTPYVGFGHGAAIFDTFYRWNRDTNTWTQMTDFPGQGRVAGQQFSYDGRGYILSGEGENHVQLETGEYWEYEPSDDSWRQLPPHPGSGRWAPGSFLIDDTIYLMGGLSTVRLEWDMWAFDMTATAGVGDQAFDRGRVFVVYPNPVTRGQFHLRDASGQSLAVGAADIRLIDAAGRDVAGLTGTSGEIRIPRLSSGKYFLSLSMEDGTRETRPILVLR